MKWKRTSVEVAGTLGAIGVVVSNVLSAAEDTPETKRLTPAEWIPVISVAVFLGTVLLTLHTVWVELERLRDAQAEALRVLRVAETGRLLAKVDRWCDDSRDAVHVHAARDLAQQLVDYVPELVSDIEQFCVGPPKTSIINIHDQSPVHDLLASLARALPDEGVWLGITLRQQVQDWTQRDDAFSRFAETIRARVSAGRIHVARIYYFTSDEARLKMAAALAKEEQAKVNVRCLGTGKPPQDVTILFAPPENSTDRIAEPFGDDLVDRLNAAHYRVICAVAFETRADGVLRAAVIYGPGHRRTDELVGLYDDRWREAKPLPVET